MQVNTSQFISQGNQFRVFNQVFLRCFRDLIESRAPRIRESYHRVPRIREIEPLQVHARYLTFSFKKIPDLTHLQFLFK